MKAFIKKSKRMMIVAPLALIVVLSSVTMLGSNGVNADTDNLEEVPTVLVNAKKSYTSSGANIYSFDSATNTISALSVTAGAMDQLPPTNNSYTKGKIVSGENGDVYAVGGESPEGEVGHVEKLSATGTVWENLPAMNPARESFQVAVMNNVLYVFGGTVDGVPVSSVEKLSSSSGWEIVKSMPLPILGGDAVVSPDGKIFVTGRTDKSTIDSVPAIVSFDPSTVEWDSTIVTSSGTKLSLYDIAFGSNGEFYLDGTTQAGQRIVQQFDFSKKQWSVVTNDQIPSVGEPGVVLGADNNLYFAQENGSYSTIFTAATTITSLSATILNDFAPLGEWNWVQGTNEKVSIKYEAVNHSPFSNAEISLNSDNSDIPKELTCKIADDDVVLVPANSKIDFEMICDASATFFSNESSTKTDVSFLTSYADQKIESTVVTELPKTVLIVGDFDINDYSMEGTATVGEDVRWVVSIVNNGNEPLKDVKITSSKGVFDNTFTSLTVDNFINSYSTTPVTSDQVVDGKISNDVTVTAVGEYSGKTYSKSGTASGNVSEKPIVVEPVVTLPEPEPVKQLPKKIKGEALPLNATAGKGGITPMVIGGPSGTLDVNITASTGSMTALPKGTPITFSYSIKNNGSVIQIMSGFVSDSEGSSYESMTNCYYRLPAGGTHICTFTKTFN